MVIGGWTPLPPLCFVELHWLHVHRTGVRGYGYGYGYGWEISYPRQAWPVYTCAVLPTSTWCCIGLTVYNLSLIFAPWRAHRLMIYQRFNNETRPLACEPDCLERRVALMAMGKLGKAFPAAAAAEVVVGLTVLECNWSAVTVGTVVDHCPRPCSARGPPVRAADSMIGCPGLIVMGGRAFRFFRSVRFIST